MLRGEGKNSDNRNQKDRSYSPASPPLPRQVKPGNPGHPGTLNSPVKRRNPRASTVDTRGFRSVYLSLITKGKKGGSEVSALELSALEVPVLVLSVHSLTNHVGRAGTGEEVVVLISVRGQCRQDCRGHVSHGRRNMFNILNLKPLSCGILRNNSPYTLV